jgi:hypothetical protein
MARSSRERKKKIFSGGITMKKKMTKIESARIVVEQKGDCKGVMCNDCFTTEEECGIIREQLKLAEAYIKRHEQKKDSRKPKPVKTVKIGEVKAGVLKQQDIDKATTQDHIENKLEKVSRPNFRKYLKNKINMKIRVTPELSEELQKICFEENIVWKNSKSRHVHNIESLHLYIVGFPYCIGHNNCEDFFKKQNRPTEAVEYNPETDTLEKVVPVEEPEPVVKKNFTPEPIKFIDHVPDVCYQVTPHSIKKKMPIHFIKKTENGEDVYYIEFNHGEKHRLDTCYRTFEEATIVAKQLWEAER